MEINVKTLSPRQSRMFTVNSESGKFGFSPALLRCVYCHDNVRCGGLHVANCESCKVCFHTECRDQFSDTAQCPTLGCGERLNDHWHGPEREDWIWSLEEDTVGSLARILDTILSLVMLTLSLVGAAIFSYGLSASTFLFGSWLSSFEVLGFQLIGLFFLLTSFVQLPFACYYSFQYLYQRTYPRRD